MLYIHLKLWQLVYMRNACFSIILLKIIYFIFIYLFRQFWLTIFKNIFSMQILFSTAGGPFAVADPIVSWKG